jgi:hypothetical protein
MKLSMFDGEITPDQVLRTIFHDICSFFDGDIAEIAW